MYIIISNVWLELTCLTQNLKESMCNLCVRSLVTYVSGLYTLGKGDRLRWMRCACAREPSNFFVANATRPVPHVERPSPSSRVKRRDLPLFSKIA